MNHLIRLYLFELLHGNRIAVTSLCKKHGLVETLKIVFSLKRRIWFNHPFKTINKKNAPSYEEKASQQQLTPALVLYDVLKERGYSEEQALASIQLVVIDVATAFLKFNVPVIKISDYINNTQSKRMQVFHRITERFFNASGDLTNESGDTMCFRVNKCLFSQYSHQLGYANLASLFCSADRYFFEQHQPNIKFERTVTLADNHQPCDFSFTVTMDNRIPLTEI